MSNEEPKPTHIAFARNLRNAMDRKGYTQATLMHRANVYASKDRQISRSNISEYCSGKRMPGPARLNAICRALDIEPDDLMPLSYSPAARNPRRARSANARPGSVRGRTEVHDMGEGKAHLIIDRLVDWETVTAITKILNAAASRQTEEKPSEGPNKRPGRP